MYSVYHTYVCHSFVAHIGATVYHHEILQASLAHLTFTYIAIIIILYYKPRLYTLHTSNDTSVQSFEELEAELLDGQKLQGPLTALEVHEYLEKEGITEK